MNVRRRTKIGHAAFTLTAAAALSMPLNAQVAPPAHRFSAEEPDADDDGLLFYGDPVILTDRSHRDSSKAWMQFRTDPCGTLLRIESQRSFMAETGLYDDPDDVDDDPSDLGREMIGRWLSEHPELAVIHDGVDKACDDGGWYDDEERPGDFQARRIYEDRGRWQRREDSAHIA